MKTAILLIEKLIFCINMGKRVLLASFDQETCDQRQAPPKRSSRRYAPQDDARKAPQGDAVRRPEELFSRIAVRHCEERSDVAIFRSYGYKKMRRVTLVRHLILTT